MKKIIVISLACLFILTCIYVVRKNNPATPFDLPVEYLQIKSIETEAECLGPRGAYTTSILSYTGGACSFSQHYSYKNTPYRALIRPNNKGFTIDSSGRFLDTLSAKDVEMIRSHDFPRMFARPQDLFHAFSLQKNVDEHTHIFQAKNRLNAPVELFLNNTEKRISRVCLLHPADSTQTIEIVPTQWKDTEFGTMVSALYLVQGGKDTFNFEYRTLKIN